MTTNGTATGPRLKQRFNDEIAPRLFEEFNYGNVMQVPRVVKVVVNSGVGESLGPGGAAILENCVTDMTTICGQKPVVNKAKKSIANFKLREGNNVGVSCTLRGARMWEFLDRTINAALPRIRDFPGRLAYSLRRSRQLLPGHPRTNRLPGD